MLLSSVLLSCEESSLSDPADLGTPLNTDASHHDVAMSCDDCERQDGELTPDAQLEVGSDSSVQEWRDASSMNGDAQTEDVAVEFDIAQGICGNGVLETGETCDDGNVITEACEYGILSCLVCAADCTERSGATRICGDLVQDPEEECDDGNTVSESCAYGEMSCTVCAADCTEQAGDVRQCGDSITDPEEACDDGNQNNQDRCTDECTLNQPCGALPGAGACPDRERYTPNLSEHEMQSITACYFALDTPSAETWSEGLSRIERLVTVTGNQRSVSDVLRNLNRRGAAGITNYNAQRLRNHNWFGFNWNDGDSDVSYWYPQGITGSSDASDDSFIFNRRLMMVSWYHKTESRPTKGVRISLVDLTRTDEIRYRHLLLVEPYENADGSVNFRSATTESGNALHAGGIVWFGRYLYVADTRKGIRVFDMDNIIQLPNSDDTSRIGVTNGRIDAHGYEYMIPQIGRYAQPSDACPLSFSSLGLDRSTDPPTLVSGEYRSDDIQARLVHWPLDAETGLLLDIDGRTYGRNARSIAQTRVQGVLSWDGDYYISSSSQYLNYGRLYRTRPGLESRITAWVYGAEDLYYERNYGLIWTPAEHPDFRDTVGIPLIRP